MRLLGPSVLCALALAGCQAKSGGGQGSDPPATSLAAGGCHAFQAGRDGVMRTFCDGPASATFAAASTSGKLGGGSCERTGQMFSFNAGVAVMPSPGAPKPDYLGLTVTGAGEFKGAILSLTWGGERWGSTEIHGNLTGSGGTFEGPVHSGNAQAMVKGSFTC